MTRKTKRRVRKNKKTHRRRRKRGGKRKTRRRMRRSSRLSRHQRRPSRRRRRRRQRGGMLQLSPCAFPPGGPYVQGATNNGLGKGYYYKNNINPYLPDPAYNNSGIPQKGGKSQKKSKHRKKQRRKKRRPQKGGFFIMENLPGGTDIQQAWWQVGNHLSNTYQAWKGGKPYISPSPSVQPIGQPQETVPVVPEANIPQIYSAAQKKAAKFKA